jgi:ubiquinone/menaquinone biosynthesis methyltransferase
VTGADPPDVRRLFDDVAPTYDLLNRLLSLGQDGRWRRHAASLLAPAPGDLLLDLCGGTGDLALEVQRQHPQCRVLLVDFAEQMVRLARPKIEARSGRWPLLAAGDACRLPLPDASCGGVTAAFGIRNLRSARAGLEEVRRVLRPGGRLAMLEFLRPSSALGHAEWAFLKALVPAVAWCVAPRRAAAYRYLVGSIVRFINLAEMIALLREVGFAGIEVHQRMFGIATIVGATRA